MSPPPSNCSSPAPANILVVDDTPANLQVLAGMLKDRGYKVRPVPSGKLALQAADRDPPDLILLDINMPDMNGYTVCEHLKADERLRGIPIIFISALTDQLDKVKAFAVGGVDYLTKPFQMEELQARVDTHLRLRCLQIELQDYTRQLELARASIDRDLRVARGVQRSFLPLRMPALTGYEFFSHYQPAQEVGGDYYDIIPLPHDRIAILLGDVVGKGVAAALLMAKLTADARFCMLTEPDPATAFTRLNAMMFQADIAERFVTLVVAVLDPVGHTVTLVNAGHPPPVVYHSATRTAEESMAQDAAAFPLGVSEDFVYTASRLAMAPGDTLLAFTDGVTEATDPGNIPLQVDGLLASFQGQAFTPKRLGSHAIETVTRFIAGRPQQDDIALVGFGRLIP